MSRLSTKKDLLIILLLIALLSAGCSSSNNKMSQSAISSEADSLFRQGMYKQAITHYKKNIVFDEKQHAAIEYQIGLCYYLLEDIINAHMHWAKARNINPDIFNGRIYGIKSNSMAPQLLSGDHVLLTTNLYHKNSIRRGDIVAFESPKFKDSNNLAIKYIQRIVGLPGETLEIKDNQVFINGEKLKEDYAFWDKELEYLNYYGGKDQSLVNIPQGKYFLLGDNRYNSFDSRYFGYIDEDKILGRAVAVYFSTTKFYTRIEALGDIEKLNELMKGARPDRVGLIIK